MRNLGPKRLGPTNRSIVMASRTGDFSGSGNYFVTNDGDITEGPKALTAYRHHLTQEIQPFCRQLSREHIDPCEVTAGPGEAGDKTKPDRVFADDEDDGDRRGCRLGRDRPSISRCCDHGDLAANQFGRQRGQPIELTLRPAVLDRYVLAFNLSSGPGEIRADGPRLCQAMRR